MGQSPSPQHPGRRRQPSRRRQGNHALQIQAQRRAHRRPTAVNTFTNSVVAYTCTESGCDYNAGITQTLGATGPFVGGYYLGEIGKQNLTSNAKGVGGGFSATNIYSRAATSIVYKNGPTNYVEKTPLLQSGSGPVQQYRLNGSRIANINNKLPG